MTVNHLPSVSVMCQNVKWAIALEEDRHIIRVLEGYHNIDSTGNFCTRCNNEIIFNEKGLIEECIVESIEKIHNS